MNGLLRDVTEFLDRHSMPPTRFSVLFAQDRSFVRRLRAGKPRVGQNLMQRVTMGMIRYEAENPPRSAAQ